MTHQSPSLNEIQPEQLALIDELDARQDDVLRKLDELTHRIEQLIELYLQNRDSDDDEQADASTFSDSDDQRQAA